MVAHAICPKTGEEVVLEGVESPLGFLITACSRFPAPCRLSCARGCASQVKHHPPDENASVARAGEDLHVPEPI